MPDCSWGVWKYPIYNSRQTEMWVTYKDKTKLAGREQNVNFTLDRADTGEWSGSVGKETDCNAGDLSSIPGLWRSLGEGSGNPLQYSSWSNSWIDEDRLSPWNCKESGHNCVTFIFFHFCAPTRELPNQNQTDPPTQHPGIEPAPGALEDNSCSLGQLVLRKLGFRQYMPTYCPYGVNSVV